jgi:peptidylprolyl isomerase
MNLVQTGDRVEIHYSVRLADGSPFFSTHAEGPQAFFAGSGEVIPGLSQGVLGMQAGERKLLRVEPQDGYGLRDPALERRVRLQHLPPGVQIGDRLEADAHGESLSVWVRAIEGEDALLDANHPLSGHPLIFEIELVSFVSSSR